MEGGGKHPSPGATPAKKPGANRVKGTKVWQNRNSGLDPGLKSPESFRGL